MELQFHAPSHSYPTPNVGFVPETGEWVTWHHILARQEWETQMSVFMSGGVQTKVAIHWLQKHAYGVAPLDQTNIIVSTGKHKISYLNLKCHDVFFPNNKKKYSLLKTFFGCVSTGDHISLKDVPLEHLEAFFDELHLSLRGLQREELDYVPAVTHPYKKPCISKGSSAMSNMQK